MTLTQGGVCEGYGGLSRAVTEVLGAELAWYSEIEPAACRLLAHHHPGVPNHGDLTTADWSQVEPVDIFTGGWPCQPWSLAGKRKGAEDVRAIWPHVARAVRALRPRLVLLENVASIAAAGELARAAGDLAAIGYVGSWRSVRASDVDAAHRRERIFILARPAADTTDLGHERGRPSRIGRAGPADHRVSVADTDRSPVRKQSVTLAGRGSAAVAGRAGEAAAYADGDRRQGRSERHGGTLGPEQQAPLGDDLDGRVLDWAGYGPAIERWERVTGRRSPAPTVLGRRGTPQLSSAFVEFLMGLPEGHVTGVPGISRNEQLKLLGNGVVPQQAAHALRLLLASNAGQVAA